MDQKIIDAFREQVSNETQGLEKILLESKKLKVPGNKAINQSWEELSLKIQNKEVSNRNIRSYKWVAAASVLIVMAIFSYQKITKATTIATLGGETRTEILPDGSKVVLNALSEITYDKSHFVDNRSILLNGEAFFEVIPGSPFKVQFQALELEVLGTSFNIHARANASKVKCLTGRVKVTDVDKTMILTPGLSLNASNGKMDATIRTFDITKAISWQEGKYFYKNEPFVNVVNELEIQYGIIVIGGKFENRNYTGAFDNKDLKNAAMNIFTPMGYTFEIADQKIFIE